MARTQPNPSAHRASANRGDASRQEVQHFLDRMARALTGGDIDTLLALWDVPAYVLGDTQAIVVGSNDAIRQFFAGAKDRYNAQGIVGTRAEIGELRWANERIAIVEVRWPYIDARGREVGEETSTYTLRRDDDDVLRLRIAVMHGASAPDGQGREPP
jgi:hypothetical protein